MRTREVELPIGGMTCAGCARAVEQELGAGAGVESATVNFATRTASIRFDASKTRLENLVAAVKSAGYSVPVVNSEQAEASRMRELRERLLVGVIFAVPVFVLGMMERSPLAQFILTIPVLLYTGLPFFHDALAAARRRTANMNITLIALGTGAAFLYSAWVVLSGGHDVYFEAAAVITVLVVFGRMLEAKATGRASDAINALIRLQPRSAKVLREGREVEIPIGEVGAGDFVIVRPGERVPVDGTIREGSSDIDESMLTGESVPAAKHAGSAVYAGTMSSSRRFSLRSECAQANTAALAGIIALVKKAQGSKAPVARMADIVSGWFTIAVLAVAVLTFAVWIIFAPVGRRWQLEQPHASRS